MGVGGCEAWDNYNPTFHLILHAHRMRNARNHGSSKKTSSFAGNAFLSEVIGSSSEGCFARNNQQQIIVDIFKDIAHHHHTSAETSNII